MNDHVPQGKFARGRIAGTTAIKVGTSHLAHRIKRPFLSQEKHEKNKELLDDKNAQLLFKALTQLRGTALKLAQMVGMDQGILPESYQKELKKSFHQVPPLNRVLVRKVMLNELSDTPENLFETFESQAFAAASLGQVHKATLNNGTKVAVKVQYPGIKTAIENDLSMIRGIARGMSHAKVIIQSLAEIEARLMEEVDYQIEARNTQWFKKHITTDGIHIPEIHEKTSSQRILTTEFITGLHLNEWLATHPSQEVINIAAQRLFSFFNDCTHSLNAIHADPNPGNYLFHKNGEITIIDFGCVRKLTSRYTNGYTQILSAYIEDNPTSLFQIYKELDMTIDNFHETYTSTLKPFGEWISLLFKEDTFDFSKNPDFTQQGLSLMKTMHEKVKVDNIAEEFIFHDRTFFGLLQIFIQMGATVSLTSMRNRII